MYLTLVCDEEGKGTATVLEVLDGKYTVEEIPDWSWRFKDGGKIENIEVKGKETVVNFEGEIKTPYWLSGLAEIVKNIFKGGAS